MASPLHCRLRRTRCRGKQGHIHLVQPCHRQFPLKRGTAQLFGLIAAARPVNMFTLSGVFLGLLTLALFDSVKSVFRKESGQFVNPPTETFSAASRFVCATKCQEKKPEECSGFAHDEAGICSLYQGEGNCQGPATIPDSGTPVTERWIRSACPGELALGRHNPHSVTYPVSLFLLCASSG